jgi:hypothetical protein
VELAQIMSGGSLEATGLLVSQTAGFSLGCACAYGLPIGISEREKLPNGTAISNQTQGTWVQEGCKCLTEPMCLDKVIMYI